MEDIPLGEGYDKKPLHLFLKKRGYMVDGEVYADEEKVRRANIVFVLPREDRPAFLRAFYVEHPSEKGLGKKMLCAVIRRYSAELTGKFIELEASGGKCPENHVHEEDEPTLDAFLDKYPAMKKDLEHDANLGRNRSEPRVSPSYEMKAEAVCAVRQNRKLVAYYRTFGFQTIDDGGIVEKMRASADDVLSECKKGGRKKKTRKAQRSRRKSFRAFK